MRCSRVGAGGVAAGGVAAGVLVGVEACAAGNINGAAEMLARSAIVKMIFFMVRLRLMFLLEVIRLVHLSLRCGCEWLRTRRKRRFSHRQSCRFWPSRRWSSRRPRRD